MHWRQRGGLLRAVTWTCSPGRAAADDRTVRLRLRLPPATPRPALVLPTPPPTPRTAAPPPRTAAPIPRTAVPLPQVAPFRHRVRREALGVLASLGLLALPGSLRVGQSGGRSPVACRCWTLSSSPSAERWRSSGYWSSTGDLRPGKVGVATRPRRAHRASAEDCGCQPPLRAWRLTGEYRMTRAPAKRRSASGWPKCGRSLSSVGGAGHDRQDVPGTTGSGADAENQRQGHRVVRI